MSKPLNAIVFILTAVLLVPIASYAAGLGTLTVRSALGQPLDAELEVLSLRAGEETFQARLAPQDAYREAGMEYSPALSGVRFSVETRQGKTIIRMRTTHPVNDPFLNLLVELHFPTGRLARQYTVLVDPAEYKVASTPAPSVATAPAAPAPTAAPSVPVPAVAAAPIVAPASAPASTESLAATPVAPAQASAADSGQTPTVVSTVAPAALPSAVAAEKAAAPAAVPVPVAAAPKLEAPEASAPAALPAPAVAVAPAPTPAANPVEPAPVVAAPAAAPRASATPPTPTLAPTASATAAASIPPSSARVAAIEPSASASADTYRIKRGDTLGAIARKWKHEGVTIHQMIIGLYQLNPGIFIRENINLIRAGATLFIPGREEVLAIREEDAVHKIRTQMVDFNKYRRSYAAGAGGSSQSLQAQRDVVSRRTAGKKATRSM